MSAERVPGTPSVCVRLGVQEFAIPPIRDCLVVGRESPIGCVALKKALSLLHGEAFEDLHPDSDVVGDVLIRANILRRVPAQKLLKLVAERIEPLMSKREVLRIDIETEVFLECPV